MSESKASLIKRLSARATFERLAPREPNPEPGLQVHEAMADLAAGSTEEAREALAPLMKDLVLDLRRN